MDNFDFVKKFISGTKNNQVTWLQFFGNYNGYVYSQNDEYTEAFYTTRNNSVVLITKREVYDQFDTLVDNTYTLLITDNRLSEMYRINSDNLFDSEDDSPPSYAKKDTLVLSRLFRLAERSAKQIDRLLEDLTDGLYDPENELPF